MLALSTIHDPRAGAAVEPDLDRFTEDVVRAAGAMADDQILALADQLHDVIRARRGPLRPLSRFAVVRCGGEWRVVSGRGRIGHFEDWNDAFSFCGRLAREAVEAGHEVEFLVQTECGELLPV